MIPKYVLKLTKFGYFIFYTMKENDRPIDAKIIEFEDLMTNEFKKLIANKHVQFLVQSDIVFTDNINILT